jgi:peptide/nickel transport system permease protein
MTIPSAIGQLGNFGRLAAPRSEFAVGISILLLLITFAVATIVFGSTDPQEVGIGRPLSPPLSPGVLLGTDELGRDLLSRLSVGIGVTLLVGGLAAALATALGIAVGGIAAYLGGYVDDFLMRTAEVFLVTPAFFVGIVLLSILGPNVFNLTLTIALLGWPLTSRVVRSEVLSLRSRPFVEAARLSGVTGARLLFREILPNAQAPIIISAALLAGQAMLLEAALSYLGLGDPNQVSLGLMLQQAQPTMRLGWWTTVLPGASLFLAIFAINLVADGVRKRLDPRMRR